MSDLDQAPNEDIQNREIYREIGLEALQSSSGMMDRIDDLSVVKGNNVTISKASITSEVNIYPASRYSQELPRSELNKFGERLADEVNKRTRKECEKFATAALNISNRKATKISCQVLPELARTDFFEGATGLEEVNYSATTTTTNITRKKREAQVFVKEIHNQGRYVLVVGAAGSGKTTLAKRYSLLALNNETTQYFKMVHFINIRDTGTEKCTPKKFLLEDHLIGQSLKGCVEHGYTWLQYEENQESVLFVFDGLDTAPWDLDDTHHPPMGYNDAKMPVTIMFNILRGHLFPKCSILLTSREYGVSRLKPELRPNASITMRGLAPKDMKSLVEDLGGDRSLDIWNAIEDKSQNLMQLCSNPLFLTFVIMIHQYEKKPPKSFSGIIIQLLERHIRSNNRSMPSERITDILHKLKRLSYSALERRSVVFSIKDLDDSGLTPDDVKDLIIGSPNPSSEFDQLLMPKDFHYFFCHQAIQEAFAAQHVSEMDDRDFDHAVTNYLRGRSGLVVRQFTCGILFNEETSEASGKRLEESERIAKREKIILVLEQDLVDHKDKPLELLSLLTSLRECGDDENVVTMVRKRLDAIRLSGISLTPSDIHAVGRVASHCKKLDIMQLVNCQLNRKSLETLVEVMKYSNVEITVFDVSFNSNLRKESMYYIHKVCIRGQGLNYWQCGFRQHHILDFVDKSPEDVNEEIRIESTEERVKLQFDEDQVLDLESYNVKNHYAKLTELASITPLPEFLRVNIIDYGRDDISNAGVSEIEQLCKLLSKCDNISELAISDSKLNGNDLGLIANAVKTKMIASLNIYLCPDILRVGWSALGNIAAACKVNNLYLTACSLEDDKLRGLNSSLRKNNAKLKKLDVSRNGDMHPNCLSEIGEIMELCECKELVAGYCNLQSIHLKSIEERLVNVKLDRIDLSGNANMNPEGFKILGEIVTKTETKQLDISECDPGWEELKNFKDSTRHANKLEKLNVSRNRRMGAEGLRQVAEMTGQYVLKDLFIRQCELDAAKLRCFQEALPINSKILHLGLGLYFMKKKPTTVEEIDILIKIIPHVKEKLTLNGWDLTVDMKKALKEAIDKMAYRGFQIVFDRGLGEIIIQSQAELSDATY